jgi:ribosomal-protein-alanine N-acetyltransferase
MHVEVLNSFHKPAIRELVKAVIAESGLHAQFYWPVDMLDAEMMSAEMIGVFEGTELAGVILYRELPEAWEISLVATDPRFRRRGFMEFLMKHLNNAKGQNREIWLEVHEENISAQKLYEKLGFRETRRRPRYYKDGATAILYSRA